MTRNRSGELKEIFGEKSKVNLNEKKVKNEILKAIHDRKKLEVLN